MTSPETAWVGFTETDAHDWRESLNWLEELWRALQPSIFVILVVLRRRRSSWDRGLSSPLLKKKHYSSTSKRTHPTPWRTSGTLTPPRLDPPWYFEISMNLPPQFEKQLISKIPYLSRKNWKELVCPRGRVRILPNFFRFHNVVRISSTPIESYGDFPSPYWLTKTYY